MASNNSAPFFSIIISTRDRPGLFEVALRSVMQQSFPDREIIVVVDGSTEENLARYRQIEQHFTAIDFHYLVQRPMGHGQSYSMNYGIQQSSGQYLGFLDDDDYWVDDKYLEGVFANIRASEKPVDVHYSNQKAVFSNAQEQSHNVWIEDLIPKVRPANRNHADSYFADTKFMLLSEGFAHLNCSIFKRAFYNAIGGMDESIRYENDRDVFIRSIDAASVILFNTRVMSLHNIPDDSKKTNMSTMSSAIEKRLYKIRVFDKGICTGKKRSIVRFCSRAKTYEQKHMASILARKHRYASAAYYARQALISGFNIRWAAYTMYLTLQGFIRSNS